jgi:acetyl-CoA C-acetyltransferase
MADPRTVPVVVGVGDLRWGSAGRPATPRAPLDLIVDATRTALADTRADDIGRQVDTIYAVKTASWAYDDLPGLLAGRIGARPGRTHTSTIGGHWPAALLDRIGAEIADGTATVALLVGGEAQASVKALMKSRTDPAGLGWHAEPGGPPTFTADDLGSEAMQRAGAITPTRVYPLFENRLGYDLGQTPAESRGDSARLYSAFSAIAAAHPVAWSRSVRTAAEIATTGPDNRPVSDAYPLAMNAMPFVDQAAAVVVCSLAAAREHGVPADRIVYLWGGAGAHDDPDILQRSDFGDSPALRSAVARTLTQAGVTGADVSIMDSYSCFPVVPKLFARALGLPASAAPSVLGGHSFFGGPLNSYTLHAIAEVTRRLRDHDDSGVEKVAMVHGNGGYLTYQHTVLLSRRAHRDGYLGGAASLRIPAAAVPLVSDYRGEAQIITATIEYGRTGRPEMALLIAQTPDGRRVAGHTGPDAAAALARHMGEGTRPLVGASVDIAESGGRLEVEIREEATR